MKRFLAGILLLISHIVVYAQQTPLVDQYIYNKFLINPAAMGYDGTTNLSLLSRKQWLGFERSPLTNYLVYQWSSKEPYYIAREHKVNTTVSNKILGGEIGIGGMVYNDRAGLEYRTGLQFGFGFHRAIKAGLLSFGLGTNIYQLRYDERLVETLEPDDPRTTGINTGTIVPDFTFGMLLSRKEYFVGLSCVDLIGAQVKLSNKAYKTYEMLRYFAFMAGYKYDLNNEAVIEPNIMIKSGEIKSLQADIGALLYYQDQWRFGLSYRTKDALIVNVAFEKNQFLIGYSVGSTFSSIRKYSFGTHELLLTMKMGKSAQAFKYKY